MAVIGSKGTQYWCSWRKGGRALEAGPRVCPKACPRPLGAQLLVERSRSSRDLDAKPLKTRRGVEHPPRMVWLGVRPTPPWPPTYQPSEGSLPSP